MIADDGSPKRRLNPFAFPAETNTRFALFVVAALMLAFDVGTFVPIWRDPLSKGPFGQAINWPEPGSSDYYEAVKAVNLQLLGQVFDFIALPLGLAIAVTGAAIMIYRFHPFFVRRKKESEALTPEKDPSFYNELQRLAATAGLRVVPAIELGKSMSSQNGQAYGFPKRYVVRLDGGLRLVWRKEPGAFRAIVLHELAHIVNRDVGRAYLAQAFLAAATVLALLPFIIGTTASLTRNALDYANTNGFDVSRLLTVDLPLFLFFAAQVGAILLFMKAIYAGLLRIRETYADWRAALWGAEHALSAILKRGTSNDRPRRWRVHPSPRIRLAALEDPSRLFRVERALPIIVGILLAFTLTSSVALVQSSFLGSIALGRYVGALGGQALETARETMLETGVIDAGTPQLLYLTEVVMALLNVGYAVAAISIIGVAYLIANTLGLQIQRQTAAEMSVTLPGRFGYLGLAVPAALFSLGVEAGFLMAPGAIGFPHSWAAFVSTALTFAGATALVWVCLAYIRFFAERAFCSHVGARPPVWRSRLITFSATGLLSMSFLPLVAVYLAVIAINSPVPDEGLIAMLKSAGWITLGLAALFYLVVFCISLLVVVFRRRPRCPTCDEAVQGTNSIGATCAHCDSDLSSWLFVNLPSIESGSFEQAP